MTRMPLHIGCLLVLAPLAWGGTEADAVNERIPVSRAALEAHWRVDCDASWNRLGSAGDLSRAGESCLIPADLRDQLQLCAFIHQPPGGSRDDGCPDYRGAVHLLDSAAPGERCGALALFLGRQAACPAPPAARPILQ